MRMGEHLDQLARLHKLHKAGPLSVRACLAGRSGEVASEPVERIERLLTELQQASGHVDTPEDPVAPRQRMIALGPPA